MSFCKLLLRSNTNLCHHIHGISPTLRPLLFFSAGILTSSSSISTPPTDSLERRIFKLGNHPTVSIVPVLEKWVEEGKNITFNGLNDILKKLRNHGRFTQALQISQWMTDRRGYYLLTGDVAIRLDLISKIHGLEEAEKYFSCMPDKWRGAEVYGALLNCYAHYKCLEKAEATMQKMREMGFLRNTLSYNVILKLYTQMGKHEKVDILIQEMEEKGIRCDKVTYKIRLNACAANLNIVEMEKLLMKMETDPLDVDWYAYVVAANVYLKAGLIEKTLAMLKISEQLIKHNSRSAYESLLTLYAAVGNKDELYRVWNLYKNMGKIFNSGYLCMISSLMKLDDVDGAERIWEEWVSRETLLDVRILNTMINAYSKKGLWEKAEAFINNIVQCGTELEPSTWGRLASAYHVGGQITKAVETIKKAISVSNPGWKPSIYTLAACLEDLKSRGDVEGAEELLKICGEHCRFSTDVYDRLKQCATNGDPSTKALVRMEGDDPALNGETPAVMEFKDEGNFKL